MSITLHYSCKKKTEISKFFPSNEVTIGRHKEIPIDLDLSPDTRVSRPHARLKYSLGTWWIEDLNSQNGTLVNGNKITGKTQLFPGDQVLMGDTVIRVEFSSSDTMPISGSLESQFPVSESEPPKEVSENLRLKIFENISKITAHLQGQPMLDAFLKEIAVVFPHADHWAIALIQDAELIPVSVRPKPSSNMSFTLARQSIVSKEALHWKREMEIHPGSPNISSLFEISSALYAPIVCNNEVIGVVHVDTTSLDHLFSEADLHLLSVIANTMGPSIQGGYEKSPRRLHHVFLSSSESNQHWVDRLAKDLRRRSIKVFIHKGVQPGQNYDRMIKNAIRDLDGFLLAWSPSTENVGNVMDEIGIAQKAKKPIIPLLIEPCTLPEAIRDIHPLDMSKKVYEQNLHNLCNVIERLPLNKPGQQDKKVKILFLAANPFETERLHLDQELREIDMRLRMAGYGDRFELCSHWAVRYSDIAELLQRYKPQIVHFSGHGNKTEGIFLEGEHGEAHSITPKILGKLFHVLKDNIRCVILNVCWSARQARVITNEIDCAVGMSKSFEDEAAIRFVGGFYQALGYERSVQEAFDLGCIEIGLAKISGNNVPKLMTKAGVNAANIFME